MSTAPVLEQQFVATPEGVAIRFATATVPERVMAFLLDLLILFLAVLAVALVAGLLGELGGVILVLFSFLSRMFYFAWFETRWNGRTPGKRRFHLRVIRADGGPLTTEVLLARNFTREVEFFLPLVFLFAPDVFWPGSGAGARLLAGFWLLALLLFPFGNRHRMRVGDLIAGTRVVVSPSATLLRDLADAAPRVGKLAAPAAPAMPFTPAQLSVYGIYELQVLEEVLRKGRSPGGREAIQVVADKIRKRIGWDALAQGDPDAQTFLDAFYRAQRARLEQSLLLGKRKERKDAAPPKVPRRPEGR